MRGSSPYLVVVYYTFLSSLCPFLGPSYLGTMAQQDSEDVISVECAESSLEGYDFQVSCLLVIGVRLAVTKLSHARVHP